MILSVDEKIANQYIIRRAISEEGSFSDVYEAFDDFHNRDVILKVVHKDAHSNKERLLKEHKVLNALDRHQFILKPEYNGVLPGDIPYFVFPLFDGQEALSNILNRGPLPPPDALLVLCQLATALAFIHNHHVYHLDVKPANVLWTGHGIKLFDFNAGAIAETDCMQLAASPSHLPPDFDAEDITHEALLDRDLYALGVTFYKCLTGTELPRSCMYSPLKYTDLAAFPELPSSAFDAVIRLLMPSKLQRYHSSNELLSNLRQIAILEAKAKIQADCDLFVQNALLDLLPLKDDWYENEQILADKHSQWRTSELDNTIHELSTEAAFSTQICFGLPDKNTYELSDLYYTELDELLDSALTKLLCDAQTHFPERLLQVSQDKLEDFYIARVEFLTTERTQAAIAYEQIEGRSNIARGFMNRHSDTILQAVRQMLYFEISKLPKAEQDLFLLQKAQFDTRLKSDVGNTIQRVACTALETSAMLLFLPE